MPVSLQRTDYRLDRIATVHSVADAPLFRVDAANQAGAVDLSASPVLVGNDQMSLDGWFVALWEESQSQSLANVIWETGTYFDLTVAAELIPAQPVIPALPVVEFSQVLPGSRFADDAVKPTIVAGDVQGISGQTPVADRLAVRFRFDFDGRVDAEIAAIQVAAPNFVVGMMEFRADTTFARSARASRKIFYQLVEDASVPGTEEGDIDREAVIVSRQPLQVGEAVTLAGEAVLLAVTESIPVARTGFHRARVAASYPLASPPVTGPIA